MRYDRIHSFRLVLPDEKWVLGAPSEEHKDAWLHMLRATIETLPKQAAPANASAARKSVISDSATNDSLSPVAALSSPTPVAVGVVESAADHYAAVAAAAPSPDPTPAPPTVASAPTTAVAVSAPAPDMNSQAEQYQKVDGRPFGWQYVVRDSPFVVRKR